MGSPEDPDKDAVRERPAPETTLETSVVSEKIEPMAVQQQSVVEPSPPPAPVVKRLQASKGKNYTRFECDFTSSTLVSSVVFRRVLAFGAFPF